MIATVKNPDPSTGAPGGSAEEEHFEYNAQGELIARKDQLGTQHTYTYDDRGRLLHDSAYSLGTGVDSKVRRISTTYDKLDQALKVTSYDHRDAGSGNVVNELECVYDKFGVVKTVYQEWDGAVVTTTSEKVEYAFFFPTSGATAVRLTSTYPDGHTVDEVYNAGIDDTISRISGRKKGTTTYFEDEYLGLGRLVNRTYGATGYDWTLVDSGSDKYLGLDRFNRIDELKVQNPTFRTSRRAF